MNRNINGRSPNGWLISPKVSNQTTLRLFCFPYSGAGASVYYKWAEILPGSIEVCAVQLPGRETRLMEEPYTELAPLVEDMAEVLRPYLDTPFAFFGHSMGALISFELSRHLRRAAGIEPSRLLVSGHQAPQVPDSEPPIHTLPEPQFIEKLRSLDGTPEEVLANAELRELILPILRADFSVCETYAYTASRPLSCPISAFGGLQDQYVPRSTMEAWRELSSGTFSLRMFPGGHFFLKENQNLLLRAIAQDLLEL